MDDKKLREAHKYVSESIEYDEFVNLVSDLKLPHNRESGFTARELATYVSLVYREKQEPDSVQLNTVIEKKNDGGVVTVTVLAPDWAGLLDSIVSVIHERGYNLGYLQGFLADRRKYGVITVSFELKGTAMKNFLEQRDTIEKLLKSMSRSDKVIMKLLRGEARKLQKY